MVRFWSKVKKTPLCWNWIAGSDEHGYGRFKADGKIRIAPRVSWKLKYGSYPKLMVLHRCDNPRCVRPGHLFLGTQKDNMADAAKKGRLNNRRSFNSEKIHCIRNHKFDDENTRRAIGSNGRMKRWCKTCHRIGERIRSRKR